MLMVPAQAAEQAPFDTPSPVDVTIGTTWDDPQMTLQDVIDDRYGAGTINCETDYMGANPGDPDPFYWTGTGFDSYLIEEVAGWCNDNIVGWYIETGQMPVIDGNDDGVVFVGSCGPGFTVQLELPNGYEPFGFYLNPKGPRDGVHAPEPECFYTNRLFNDLGPDGSGAVHPPFDGDAQALVYDVSRFTRPHTWLVCWEDFDSGPMPGPPCCHDTDNDYNDMVFEITVAGVMPVRDVTFGSIKALYR
jgi:hypothetical protein